jgi:hypothetical protein
VDHQPNPLLRVASRQRIVPQNDAAVRVATPFFYDWLSLPRTIFSSMRPSLLCVGLAAGLTGCAAPSSYMGISLNSNATDIAIQQQAQLALSGDKQAQLDLGIRFEEGLGVERDLRKAKKLYLSAASDSGGTIWVYSPPVRNGTSGRVIPVASEPLKRGLQEAKLRLATLQ